MFQILKENKIILTRGDTAVLNVDITDPDGNAYEMLEGDTLTLTVKENTRTKAIILQVKSVSTVLRIESSDTDGKGYGVYYYDVQLKCSTGDIHTVIPKSEFVIGEEVTFQ